MQEEWKVIQEFTNYEISNYGRIFNINRKKEMRPSKTNHGHLKITLSSDWTSDRYTRGVAQLVGEAFVEAPNILCDTITLLDGDLENVNASNIVWRPRWFSWKYTRQLKSDQPNHYKNLYVVNRDTGYIYKSVIECGMIEGLLFDDIWRSTYSGESIFPYGYSYAIVKRV